MFISIVLNTEYLDVKSRKFWYLKNLLHCKKDNSILITHEYMKHHFEEIQNDVSDRFFIEFEMEKIPLDDLSKIEQYYISDDLFETLEKEAGSRTEALFKLYNSDYQPLTDSLESILRAILEKHPEEKIEGIFHSLETSKSLRQFAERHSIPLIPYVFSAIRKPHGYRQTLYQAMINDTLYCSNQCQTRYKKFLTEKNSIPVYDNKSLITIFGKERTLPLLKLLDYEPENDAGVCGEGFLLLPHIFQNFNYTDDDIYYELNKEIPGGKFINRQHPMSMDKIGFSRIEMHNDPASFILSCKIVTAVCSQILLKALLWNRTAVMKKNTLPFSFACEKDYKSDSKVDLKFLNYYLLCYLIPSKLMFSTEYWRWRLNGVTETEIYLKHLKFYKDELNIDLIDSLTFKDLLLSRSNDLELIESLCSGSNSSPINYDLTISRFVVAGVSYYRLNIADVDSMISEIQLTQNFEDIAFSPLDDKSGFVKINSVEIKSADNITKIDTPSDYKFYNKYELIPLKLPLQQNLKGCKLRINWSYKNINDFIRN